jgi:hypothetical protein
VDLEYIKERLHDLASEVPQTSMNSHEPMQHHISGTMHTTGFAHQVVTVQVTFRSAAIAFGTIDENFWISFPLTTPGDNVASLLAA